MISVPAQPKTLLEELQAKILATSRYEEASGSAAMHDRAAALGESEHVFYPAGGAVSLLREGPEFFKH
jgi:hypothetical protein